MSKWPVIRFSDLFEKVDRKLLLNDSEYYSCVGVRWYGMGAFVREKLLGAEISRKQQWIIKEGDVVYNKLFAWKGAFAIADRSVDGCIVSDKFPTYRAKPELIDRRWLECYFQMPAIAQQAEALSKGAAAISKLTLNPPQFWELTMPLPPLGEQRRVVARIDKLSAQIHEARTLRRQAVDEAEALVASASARFFEPKRGWTIKQVGDFCESPQYGYTESASQEPIGPRFLRITDIQDGRVNWDTVPYCHCPEPAKYLLKPNDLVFARTGATTGKSFVIQDCPEAVFASYLIRLRVRDTVSVDYLYRYFQSPSYWRQIADEKKGTGQPNLNGSKLEKLRVPIAPPEEQRRIVAELDALQAEVDTVKLLQAQTAAELDALMPSILDKAFRGEL